MCPFEGEITKLIKTGIPNRVTAAISNTLTPHTLPPGTLTVRRPPNYPEGYFVQNLQFDFFNYTGIHRTVKLYTTPSEIHIDDIFVVTNILPNGSATVDYEIMITENTTKGVVANVELKGRMGRDRTVARLPTSMK